MRTQSESLDLITRRVAAKYWRKKASQGVAMTILKQMGGANKIMAMTGAKRFLTSPNSVTFKFSNRLRGKPNSVLVTLDPDDTYTVEFHRVGRGGLDVKTTGKHSGIYAESLRSLFERATGLTLRL